MMMNDSGYFFDPTSFNRASCSTWSKWSSCTIAGWVDGIRSGESGPTPGEGIGFAESLHWAGQSHLWPS